MTEPQLCYAADGLIDPSMIPCKGLNAENIGSAATTFRTQGGQVRTNGSTVATAWSAIGPHYVAPETDTLLAVMTPVATDTDLFGAKMESVAGILDDFAEEVPPIQKALEDLKIEAEAFVAEVRNGVWVQPWEADHPQYSAYISSRGMYGTGTTTASYSGSWGSTSTAATAAPKTFSGTIIPWRDHGPTVDRNRELIHAVADQYALLDEKQVAAANRVLALLENSCAAPLEAVEAWQLKQDGVELPWGTAVEKNRDCGESFTHGIGEAFVGMGEGIGSLFGYNPLTGDWGDGEWAGQAWQGLGLTLAGIATFGPLTLAVRFGPEGVVPDAVRNFVIDSQDAALNAVKGIVAWDTWSENPAEAAGTSLVNIGTFFIPGAGVAAGVLKTSAAGARVASIAGGIGKVADVVVPGGSFVIKALAEGTLAASLRLGRGLDDMIDVSALTKADSALHLNPSALVGHAGDNLLGQLGDVPSGLDLPSGFTGHTGGFDFGGGAPGDLPSGFDGPGGFDAPSGFDGPGGLNGAPGGFDAPSSTPAHLNASHVDGTPMSFDEWNTAHGDTSATLNTNKGHFGEIRAEEYLRENGFERIDDGADGTKNPNTPGVDGIFRRELPGGGHQYVVVEAKYNTAGLGNTLDGRQMGSGWLDGVNTGTARLDDALRQADPSIADDFFDAYANGDVDSVLARVDPNGDVTVSHLDADGYVVKGEDPLASALGLEPTTKPDGPLEIAPPRADMSLTWGADQGYVDIDSVLTAKAPEAPEGWTDMRDIVFRTEPDTQLFWTGRTEMPNPAGTPYVGSADLATGLAEVKGGTTLELYLSENQIEMPRWSRDPEVQARWGEVSAKYAESARGTVRVVLGRNIRPDAVWIEYEFGALKANSNVSQIVAIDPATGGMRILFERGLND